MIKTLYLRVVLTFSAVVVVSVSIAFPIALMLYTNRITSDVQASMFQVGEQLVAMSNEYRPENIEVLLEGSTKFNDGFSLYLYDANGRQAAFGVEKKNRNVTIEPEDLASVLRGNIYQNENLDFNPLTLSFKDPTGSMVGFPLTVKGEQYALFIKPKLSEEGRKQGRNGVTTVLLIVLAIGSVLILIASTFIVNPIKKLTLATNRLARGNFDVNVKIKRKDEIGLLAEGFNHMAGELKLLEQMRQDFISNVSHEIQSPLTSIRGFSKALRQPDIKEEDRLHYLAIIERESERLSRLSENLLKLASLESKHHPFSPTTFDLDEQLRRIVVFYEPQWSDKQLELDMDLPRVKISADVDQLDQVWMNLLGNAIKFTPRQGVIRIRLETNTDRIRVSIQNSGEGIRKEDQERIFDRFYKADHSRQRGEGGSGLGLAIVRKIVEVHQGGIEVLSDPGQGALFTVTLPAVTHYSPKSYEGIH